MGFFITKLAQILAGKQKTFPRIKFNSYIPVHYQRLKAFKPDVIYAHDLSSLPLCHKVAEETNCKLIFDSHELEIHRNPPLGRLARRQVHKTEKEYLPDCDFVTTVCESAENILRSEYGIRNTDLIYNAPALGGGRSHPRWERFSGVSIRSDAGLNYSDFALVYVGLITLNRGIEFALRAIEHLPENIKLLALGPGTSAFKKQLLRYAAELGLEERFTIMDPVNPPDVYKYIRNADAAIIPITPITLSYEVALPNKFFESAFAGLPIISADLVEITKLTNKYNLGITYDALDEQACANAILEVYENQAKYKPSSANTEAFQKEFSWEAQEKKLVNILDTVLSYDGAQERNGHG